MEGGADLPYRYSSILTRINGRGGADLLYRYSVILTRTETRINGREGGGGGS